MKGGKRLTEEERASVREALDSCTDWGSKTAAKAILERDDEPEYCTCGHAHGMHSADVWACDDCGKPVKGE